MNTPFQDTQIDNKNLRIYQETSQEELTKNVNPFFQQQVISLKKRPLKSLSPDRSPKESGINIFASNHSKTSKSQACITINSNSNFLPLLSNNSSIANLNIFADSKSRLPNSVVEISKSQSFSANFINTNHNSSGIKGIDSNKTKMKTIFSDDRQEQERSLKLGFLKNKYEKAMKQTFILKNKGKQNSESWKEFNSYQKYEQMNKSNSINKFNQYNNNGSFILQQNKIQRSQLGIFIQKKKDIEDFTTDTSPQQNQSKGMMSSLNSTYKYDKIYKMFVEQQQKLQQKEQQNQNSQSSNQFSNFDYSKFRKTVIRNGYRFKTIDNNNSNEQIDQLNSRRSLDYNQLSPNLQLYQQKQNYIPQEQSELQSFSQQFLEQKQKSQEQKFFQSKRKQNEIFKNNPLSLQGATLVSNSEGLISQQSSQQNIFSNNAIKKIFIQTPTTIPSQSKKQSFLSSEKEQNGSLKDTSIEEIPMNILQEQQRKGSSFSISLQQNSQQIHKPYQSQSSVFRRIQSQKNSSNINNQITHQTQHSKHLSLQAQINYKDEQMKMSKKEDLVSEDEELCSPALNIQNVLFNLNEMNQDDFIFENKQQSSPLITLQKINSSQTVIINKDKVKKQVDFAGFGKEGSDQKINSDDKIINGQISNYQIEKSDNDNNEDEDENNNGTYKNSQIITKKPSIAFKLDLQSDDNLENDGYGSGEQQQEGEEENIKEDNIHGFTLKRQIDFAQLKELRDKTINRLQAPPRNPQQSNNTLNRQKSTNNSQNIIGYTSPKNKQSSKSLIKQDKFDSKPILEKNQSKFIDKDEQLKNETKKANLLKFRNKFKKTKKKSKGKKDGEQDQINLEQKQKEQDEQIANKLSQMKDKLRMSIKVVIREQIQKRIQSTLSQSILNQQKSIDAPVSMNEDFQINNSNKDIKFNSIQNSPLQKMSPSKIPLNQIKLVNSDRQIKKYTQSSNASNINSKSNSQHSSQSSSQKIMINQDKHNSNLSPVGLSKYSLTQNQNSSNQNTMDLNIQIQNSTDSQLVSPLQSPPQNKNGEKFIKLTNNPTYDQQQKEVQDYSAAIMNFFNACVDNMKDSNNIISHDFQLKGMKQFNENINNSLLQTFSKELKNQNMSDEEVERFMYIYEINAKMHIFYKGIVQLLGGIHELTNLIQQIVKKISSNLTLLTVNYQFSSEALHRRIIPGICALLCDDHKLFYQTLKVFINLNLEEFSFIDFFFIKKYIFSLLTKQEKKQISIELSLTILQKIESVRRYIFPINILSDSDLRKKISEQLFKCNNFMELFNDKFKLQNVKTLINTLFDYFYYDGEDPKYLDFNQIKKCIEPYVVNKVIRKIFDYIEDFTLKLLLEDPFTLNIIVRDIHYKFIKVKLGFGFKQGIFGIIRFDQNEELIEGIREEIIYSAQYGSLEQFDESEIKKVQQLQFFSRYLKFLLSEYDIYSVYDTQVSLSYFGITQKIFRFWLNCLHVVLLTKFNLEPQKVQVLIRFVEVCCPIS